MAKVEGLEAVLRAFKDRAAKVQSQPGGPEPSVKVSFTANYAIYVHENKEHKLEGQPRPSGIGTYWSPAGASAYKFLEAPARQMQGELRKIIVEASKKGLSLSQALLLAGLKLQAEAQHRVPVEYGVLKASATTRLETK